MSNKLKNPHEIDLLLEALANFVSEDTSKAAEFLKEEGLDPDPIVKEDIAAIYKLRANLLLEKGEVQQSWFEKKKEDQKP